MNYAVVTGASKGLGESTTKYLLASGIAVVGISRTDNEDFHEIAKENDVSYTHFKADLSKLDQVESLLKKLTDFFKTNEVETLFLVNNAAMVEPIKKASKIKPEALQRHFQLNVVAPMSLMNHLISICEETVFVGANITSGAATQAYYGWSAYGSSKASIEMYTKTVALEQRKQGRAHKVFAFSPGIMDTDMQDTIRATDAEDFVEVERFKKYKADKLLVNTKEVATILVDILLDLSEIKSGKIYSVKEYF